MRSQTDRRPPQRSDHRREAILDALDGWLHESSLEAINIAEISKQAGVTRSAFYFYFENKGAAVAALMERMVDETFAVNDAFTSATNPPGDASTQCSTVCSVPANGTATCSRRCSARGDRALRCVTSGTTPASPSSSRWRR